MQSVRLVLSGAMRMACPVWLRESQLIEGYYFAALIF
jgi:hypothetical protein